MLNWDDLRYVLALAKAGSLARAARALDVDHTTVGRRIEALEAALGVQLFTRTTAGYCLTAEGETLLPEIHQVEEAVLALERGADARSDGLEGTVRITSGHTFSACYLAPRLAAFGARHAGLTVELVGGAHVFDLARREADVAVRFLRSKHDHLVVRKAGEMAYALYASDAYLAGRPTPRGPDDLAGHRILGAMLEPGTVEAPWVQRIARRAHVALTSNVTYALLVAARAGGGIAVLPRYIGDVDPALRRVPMPDEPKQPIWLTVHRDLARTRRVRAVLDFLYGALEQDRALLAGG